MWKELLKLFKQDDLCDQAFREALDMLEASKGMFHDSVISLRRAGRHEDDIYDRDRQLNKFERSVRRKIVTHLSISDHPDVNMALVLTAIVMDIERIGDYTKNIVELAMSYEQIFEGGEIEEDLVKVESCLALMFDKLLPALKESDENAAREIYAQHESLSELVERNLTGLMRGELLAGNSGLAVTATLYLRYLKRISAHLKNVATSVVNPYYRIGFREKPQDQS